MNDIYFKKYLKYKNKYHKLKGGTLTDKQEEKLNDYNVDEILIQKLKKNPGDTSDEKILEYLQDIPEYLQDIPKIALANEYGINFIYGENEYSFQERIFQSEKYQKDLKKEEEKYKTYEYTNELQKYDENEQIKRKYEQAMYFNVKYNHRTDTDSVLFDRIGKSQIYLNSVTKTFNKKCRKSNSSSISDTVIPPNPTVKIPIKTPLKSPNYTTIPNYNLVKSPGDGDCLYWSLSSAYNQGKHPSDQKRMDEIKYSIKQKYKKYITDDISKMNIEQLFDYVLEINNDDERHKTLYALAMGLYDTSLMNLGDKTPKTPGEYIDTFDIMYGGQSEIQIFVLIYNVNVLSIDSINRRSILYRTNQIEKIIKFEQYITSKGEKSIEQVFLGYNDFTDEQKKNVIVISRVANNAHYDWFFSTNGNPIILPDNYLNT